MSVAATDVVPVVASDWLRPRLGRTWTRGVVVGVTPRAAYIRIDTDGNGDWGLDRGGNPDGADVANGIQVGARGARPWPPDGTPDDRGLLQRDLRRRPATSAGSLASRSVVRAAGSLLALEAPGAVGLPNGLDVVTRGVVEQVRLGQSVTLDGDRIRIGGLVLGVRRWRRSRPVPGAADDATIRHRLEVLGVVAGRSVPTDWPDPPVRLCDGIDDLAALLHDGADRVDVVDRLLGWGSGSTPAGDDLLAAWIATTTVLAPRFDRGSGREQADGLRRVVARVQDRAPVATTALSATLLDAATAGAMARPAGGVLAALTAPGDAPTAGGDDGVDDLSARLDDLAAVGHTSGRDLACGMLGAVCHLVAAPASLIHRPVTIRSGQA